MLATFIVYAFAALIAIGGLSTVLRIGKPQKPITPGVAAVILFFASLELWGLVYLAGQVQ